jgi:hypothetical protein
MPRTPPTPPEADAASAASKPQEAARTRARRRDAGVVARDIRTAGAGPSAAAAAARTMAEFGAQTVGTRTAGNGWPRGPRRRGRPSTDDYHGRLARRRRAPPPASRCEGAAARHLSAGRSAGGNAAHFGTSEQILSGCAGFLRLRPPRTLACDRSAGGSEPPTRARGMRCHRLLRQQGDATPMLRGGCYANAAPPSPALSHPPPATALASSCYLHRPHSCSAFSSAAAGCQSKHLIQMIPPSERQQSPPASASSAVCSPAELHPSALNEWNAMQLAHCTRMMRSDRT